MVMRIKECQMTGHSVAVACGDAAIHTVFTFTNSRMP
jgi:hypothetical protein